MQDNDYEHHVRQNVFKFMHERLRVPQEEAVPIWQKAFAKYNQTLKGLRKSGFEFDVEEYWDFIRAGAEEYLSPDPQASVLHSDAKISPFPPNQGYDIILKSPNAFLHCRAQHSTALACVPIFEVVRTLHLPNTGKRSLLFVYKMSKSQSEDVSQQRLSFISTCVRKGKLALQVRAFFLSLPQKKWLFTNANEKSARHCLQLLNLQVQALRSLQSSRPPRSFTFFNA